jgi:hypothetical protein
VHRCRSPLSLHICQDAAVSCSSDTQDAWIMRDKEEKGEHLKEDFRASSSSSTSWPFWMRKRFCSSRLTRMSSSCCGCVKCMPPSSAPTDSSTGGFWGSCLGSTAFRCSVATLNASVARSASCNKMKRQYEENAERVSLLHLRQRTKRSDMSTGAWQGGCSHVWHIDGCERRLRL